MTALKAYRHDLPERFVRPAEFMGMIVLELDKMGLPVEAAFEPDAFGHRQSRINAGSIIRVHGNNGRCWATVTGVNHAGNLIVEPDTFPGGGTAEPELDAAPVGNGTGQHQPPLYTQHVPPFVEGRRPPGRPRKIA